MTRAQTMRRQFLREMDTLIEDVTTLCDNTNKQKQLSLQPAAVPGSESGGHAPAPNTSGGDAHPKRSLADKAFVWRESQLSVLLRQPNFRTIYHIFVSVFILFTAKVLLNEYLETDERFISLPLLRWNFTGFFDRVVPTWYGARLHVRARMTTCSHMPSSVAISSLCVLHAGGWGGMRCCRLCMFAGHALVVPLMWLWRRAILSRTVYAAIYAVLLTGFVIGGGVLIQRLQLPVANGFLLLCEQVRPRARKTPAKTHRFCTPNTGPLTADLLGGLCGLRGADAYGHENARLLPREHSHQQSAGGRCTRRGPGRPDRHGQCATRRHIRRSSACVCGVPFLPDAHLPQCLPALTKGTTHTTGLGWLSSTTKNSARRHTACVSLSSVFGGLIDSHCAAGAVVGCVVRKTHRSDGVRHCFRWAKCAAASSTHTSSLRRSVCQNLPKPHSNRVT